MLRLPRGEKQPLGCFESRIIIFAMRKIFLGEELTYDINFAKEVDKIEYYCEAKKCKI